MTTKKSGKNIQNKQTSSRALAFTRWFFSTVITLICLGGILYGTAHLLARTDGCRGLVEENLEEHLGYPVTVESTATDKKLNLIIAGLLTDSFKKPGAPGYGVEMIIVDWSLLGLMLPDRDIIRSVTVKRANLSLVLDKNGEWVPKAFAPMAMWLAQWARFDMSDGGKTTMPTVAPEQPASKKKKSTDDIGIDQKSWEQISLELDDCGIRWWDHNGHELASAVGINLFSTPVDVPKRRLQHYRVEIDKANAIGKQQAADLIFELLATQGHHILLCFNADWEPVKTLKPVAQKPVSSLPVEAAQPRPEPSRPTVNKPERLPLQPEYTHEPIPEVAPIEVQEMADEMYIDEETDELIEQIRDVLQDALPDEGASDNTQESMGRP